MASATAPGPTTTNFAGNGTHVGAQAGVFIGDVYQQVTPDDPPETKYRLGVAYLDGGMAPRARPLIEEALAKDFDSSEVRFHWLLALLSGRTFHQFPEEDVRQIKDAKSNPHCNTRDPWGSAIQVIFRFFDSLLARATDLGVLDDLDELQPEQRDKILRHLDVFLKGPIENDMWERERKRAKDVRTERDRENRVWKFFVPAPVGPRIRQPVRPTITICRWITAALPVLLLAAAGGYLGWELLWHGSVFGLLAFLASVTGGWMVAVTGVRRRFLAERREARKAELRGPHRATLTDGCRKFATEVEDLFRHYFRRYVPENTDRDSWLRDTAGIRATLCAEMVDLYRGTRDSSGQVRWLIKHHSNDVRERARSGELWNYQVRFRTRPATEAAFAIASIALIAGAIWAVDFMAAPAIVKAAVVIALMFGGSGAASTWLPIAVARKRYAVESAEYEQRLLGCQKALEDWRGKLADKPTDAEMAAWLDADQKYLMSQAMSHYKLARSDVIAHAFIAEPAPGHKYARVPGGPVRYSRYRVYVFLLTADGVRQVVFSLTFGNGRHSITERTNYRFDSIAAVQARPSRQSLELRLVSGQKITMQLSDPDEGGRSAADDTTQEPDAESPLGSTLAPASLANTIHVLEGIAAEGKEWIRREQRQSAAGEGS